uniref:Uncharacterized protein n=1 Tax=Anguilla anguilla TaxID=7936 RepID=A0A0E9RTH5_ANGAN
MARELKKGCSATPKDVHFSLISIIYSFHYSTSLHVISCYLSTF